jgi:uncharacterized membrane protein YjgN (DUF898 family)
MEPLEPLAPAALDVPATTQLTARQAVIFHGKGGEYFGIWIVNLLLTLLTFGIYSAWAKVRRMRYFYQHTELAGATFDYHGRPLSILKGRIIALGLVMVYNLSAQVSLKLFGLTLLLLALVMPWLLRQSFRFRLHNSSYRGLRFGFTGTLKDSYITFLVYGFFMYVTAMLAGPLFHRQLKAYQHGNSHYGQTRFSFNADIGQFYKAYGVVMGLGFLVFVLAISGAVGVAIVAGHHDAKPDPAVTGIIAIAVVVLVLIGSLLISPLWEARTQNLIWNHTRLGEHQFESRLSAWRLLGIHLGNFVLVALTLGLYMPWASVRLARYRASALTLLTAGSLEDFVAAQETETSATGEEAAAFFDIDIGL